MKTFYVAGACSSYGFIIFFAQRYSIL